MTTATIEARITKEPLLYQTDLHLIREAAGRTLVARRAADRLARRLSRAELQLLALCDAILDIVTEDPTGNLVLRESPGLPTEHQTKLAEDAA